MATRYFALIIGIAFLIAGIAGFIPGLTMHHAPNAPDLAIDANHGLLFGLFPVNVLHNVVHIAIGIWGIASYASTPKSVTFSKSLTFIYGAFALMGLIPVLNTTFGLVPLYGHDIWLHAGTAVVAAYFGFVRHDERSPFSHRTAASH